MKMKAAMKSSIVSWCLLVWGFTIVVPLPKPVHHAHQHPVLESPLDASPVQEDELTDWRQVAQEELDRAKAMGPHLVQANNIILFIGDGLGMPTITAARIYMAQQRSLTGQDVHLAWERFPHTGISKTYNVDFQTPDSSSTATAMLTGEKTRYGTVGVNQKVARGNCSAVAGNELSSALHLAKNEGKWTGIVTTTSLTHATPASAFAHSAERDWENDGGGYDGPIPIQCQGIAKDSADQLVTNVENEDINVLLGGGRWNFLPNNISDPEYTNDTGHREDGRNLIKEWEDKKAASDPGRYQFVWNFGQFDAVQEENTDYLLGMFEPYHMRYEWFRPDDRAGEPSLAEMTQKAIKILSKREQGYFLLVEGGLIDWAHHDNFANLAINETVAMSDAVAMADSLTNDEDTLIIVTADHSHPFGLHGYQIRDADILGPILRPNGEPYLAEDGKPYLNLAYMNGPGFGYHRSATGDLSANVTARKNITGDNTRAPEYLQDAAVPRQWDSHAGEDVPIYAKGPLAYLFQGVHEQNYIGHAILYAGCLEGEGSGHCAQEDPDYPWCPHTGSATPISSLHSVALLLFVITRYLIL